MWQVDVPIVYASSSRSLLAGAEARFRYYGDGSPPVQLDLFTMGWDGDKGFTNVYDCDLSGRGRVEKVWRGAGGCCMLLCSIPDTHTPAGFLALCPGEQIHYSKERILRCYFGIYGWDVAEWNHRLFAAPSNPVGYIVRLCFPCRLDQTIWGKGGGVTVVSGTVVFVGPNEPWSCSHTCAEG